MSAILFVLLIGFVVGLSVAVWLAFLNVIVELPLPVYFFGALMSFTLIVAFWVAIFQVFG